MYDSISKLQCAIRVSLDGPSAVEAERRNLKELLATASDECRSLMWEIDEFLDIEPVRVIVCEDGGVRGFGLSDNKARSRLVEEDVVHQAAPPGHHTVRSSEAGISHEGMSAAVVVACVVVCA